MKRRTFITGLGGAAAMPSLLWPTAPLAQPGARVRRIGILLPFAESDTEVKARVAAFRQQLQRLGWTEGSNVQIIERWATDNMDRVRAAAAELVNLKPDVIMTQGGRVVPVLQQATRSIPIVFAGISDPLGAGIVTSLARPGGNTTGFALLEFSVIGKMLETLKQIVPRMTRVVMMFNPDNPTTVFYERALQAAAPLLGLHPMINPIHGASDIEQAMAAAAQEPNSGLMFPPDVTAFIHRELIITRTNQNRLPALFGNRVFVAGGGLMSYGTDQIDQYRRVASYVDRILRGEAPGDLPVQQPTKYELMINLRTAKTLGVDVPAQLLAIADEVIE